MKKSENRGDEKTRKYLHSFAYVQVGHSESKLQEKNHETQK